MNAEIKEIIAVTLLVLGILQGTTVAVSEERSMDGILRTLLLLGAAALFYLWLMRERRSAEEAAEDALDEVEKQMDVVKEAVQDTKVEKVEKTADDVPVKTPEPAKPDSPKSTPVPKAKSVSIEVEDDKTEPEPVAATAGAADDLTMIEGIGPAYRDILVSAGVNTFAKLAAMSADDIVALVRDKGGRKSASMATWGEQAKLAAAGDWDGLAKLKAQLSGGSKK